MGDAKFGKRLKVINKDVDNYTIIYTAGALTFGHTIFGSFHIRRVLSIDRNIEHAEIDSTHCRMTVLITYEKE